MWKSERTLRAYCTDGTVLTMHAAIGQRPEGPKLYSGDARTPEGRYAVAGAARESQYHLFIPIDYPSARDATRALDAGRIDSAVHEQIVEARARGGLPPQDTPLGGAIGLHGEGPRHAGDTARGDWTLGCIAVTDAEIEHLAERVEVGVPVWIHP